MAKPTCSIPGCERPSLSRSWCSAHYARWKATGDPRESKPIGDFYRGPVLERLFRRVTEVDGCWIYSGSGPNGYGVISTGPDRKEMAHRVAYEALVSSIPVGMQLDHLCRVKKCVNPAHLEPVTPRENTLRSESLSAQRARQTECKRGHPLVWVNGGKRRRCPTCIKAGAAG